MEGEGGEEGHLVEERRERGEVGVIMGEGKRAFG